MWKRLNFEQIFVLLLLAIIAIGLTIAILTDTPRPSEPPGVWF